MAKSSSARKGNRGNKRSALSKRTNQRRNTKTVRKRMSTSNFALPQQRKYRIDDKPHARNALARVAQHGTPSERKRVRAAVTRKFPSLKR